MPPSHEILTDDYVAELLSKEANDCSLKYSAMGLDAFKSDKRPANQPKPNTRFLNNIIRDTNNHNRALLARENAESQARLRDLEEADRRKRDEDERRERRFKPGLGDTRKRMLGDIAAILGGSSKKRRHNESNSKVASVASDRDEPNSTHGRDRKRRHRDDDSKSKSRSRRDDHRADSRDHHRHSHRHSHHREERRRHHRSSSGERREDRHREHRERSSREKDDGSRHHHRLEKGNTHQPTPSSSKIHDTDSDSDPLDDLIGPAPPSKSTVRRRGRGHNAAMSGIDGRFAADYDPTIDVTPDPDEGGHDDWDNAVETFRDRQKWKQQGADRLRSAGFTEEQIRKWEKGDKKDESDVRWDKAGGVREWDRGKVLDADGGVSPEPEFGRLKGT
ncbi:hypothetical protein F5Y09DRAFT_180688 [Xylaria sp. FL1042]|nr:hypothetical protein F5Y09DRAFT_180688 [Xylaria sp. FL1042]